jgi:hypothetical protein
MGCTGFPFRLSIREFILFQSRARQQAVYLYPKADTQNYLHPLPDGRGSDKFNQIQCA